MAARAGECPAHTAAHTACLCSHSVRIPRTLGSQPHSPGPRGSEGGSPGPAGKAPRAQAPVAEVSYLGKGSAAGGRAAALPRSSGVWPALVLHHAQRVSKRDRKEHLAASPMLPPHGPAAEVLKELMEEDLS